MLVVSSLLSIVLFTIHLVDDFVRGIDPNALSPVGLLIVGVWLVGALLLSGRRLGFIILLLGGILATGVCILHFRGSAQRPGFAQSENAFRFLWTLYLMGVSGPFSAILAVRELVMSWRTARPA